MLAGKTCAQARTHFNNYSLASRFKLFHGCITPAVLYGCESWVPTAEAMRQIQSTQRQMLRMIVQVQKRRFEGQPSGAKSASSQRHHPRDVRSPVPPSTSSSGSDVDSISPSPPVPATDNTILEETSMEPWVDWIRLSTHVFEHHYAKICATVWLAEIQRRRW